MNINELGMIEQVNDVFFNTRDAEVYNFMRKTNRKVRKSIVFELNRPFYISLISISCGVSTLLTISYINKKLRGKK